MSAAAFAPLFSKREKGLTCHIIHSYKPEGAVYLQQCSRDEHRADIQTTLDKSIVYQPIYLNYIIRKNRPWRLLRRRPSRRHPLQSRLRNRLCCPRPRRPIRQRCPPTRQRSPQHCRPTLISESSVRGRRKSQQECRTHRRPAISINTLPLSGES
jgi:hypothetical protein